MFVLELAAAISAFALQGQVKEMVRRTLNESMANYNGNPSVEQSVDFMQQVVSVSVIQKARSSDKRVLHELGSLLLVVSSKFRKVS